LRAIREEVDRFQQTPSNMETLRPIWSRYVQELRRRVDGVHIEADGEVAYLGDLSPGCQACKDGAWDCIFTTMQCNLDCGFCYSPHAIPGDYAGSAFGSTPDEIAANHARTRITGISFSGGEPFVDPQGLFGWVAALKDRRPEAYTWVYTNGLLAGEVHLRRLAELGIDEIRFNTAATGYDHPAVLDHIAAAARLIPHVTVEIPAIPEDGDKLLSCLGAWCTAGVRFLNLHELMYEPGTNAATMAGARMPVVTDDGHRSAINPDSRALTLEVMVRVRQDDLDLSVNDCSLQSKLRQLRGRRRSLAPLVKADHERLVEDRVYEGYCAYRREEVRFFHPDRLDEMRERYPDHRFVRLVRMAPLSLEAEGGWIGFEAEAPGG
jgi:pyruvate formate-lyase activating enzyme-like uncharacterized protein